MFYCQSLAPLNMLKVEKGARLSDITSWVIYDLLSIGTLGKIHRSLNHNKTIIEQNAFENVA